MTMEERNELIRQMSKDGFTQAEIAAMVGISRQRVGQIPRGQRGGE